MRSQTDIVAVAADPRNSGYECDVRDAAGYARSLRSAWYTVRIGRTVAEGRRLITWRRDA